MGHYFLDRKLNILTIVIYFYHLLFLGCPCCSPPPDQAPPRGRLPHLQVQHQAEGWTWVHPGGDQGCWIQQEYRQDHGNRS